MKVKIPAKGEKHIIVRGENEHTQKIPRLRPLNLLTRVK
jgi:hypothetical protein